MSEFPADIEAALSTLAKRQTISRDEAVERILRESLRMRGFLSEDDASGQVADVSPDQPDPEFVQYPGYFKDGGRL